MTVGLKGGQRATQDDIAHLEALIGEKLDNQFCRFIANNDGAELDDNSFPVQGIKHMGGINSFIPTKLIIQERSSISGIGAQAYPIALSAGGNYILLDQGQNGAILFWDHEIADGISKIAENFDEFLSLIEPFNDSSVRLAPGQVKSAWIDPDFLKKLGG